MQCFNQRLHTFKGWPHDFIRPDQLAHAGFKYTSDRDLVVCDFCGVKVGTWQPNDDALLEHKKWSPNCPFLKSLGGEVIAEDTCGMYGIGPPREVFKVSGPRYPRFASKEERLKTFKNWPKSLKQKPEELAEAGFFYINVGDKTICFYCGVGCKDWEEPDAPWEEHAKWSPKCVYLLLHKGEEFVSAFDPKEEASARAKAELQKEEAVNGKKQESKGELDNAATCKVCYDKEVGVVFVPCGHAVCLDCAPALTKCHICRAPIQRFIRIYMT